MISRVLLRTLGLAAIGAAVMLSGAFVAGKVTATNVLITACTMLVAGVLWRKP